MACRTNNLGVYTKLLDAINLVKSGGVGDIEIKYSISKNFNLNVSTDKQLLKVEIFNAFKLWEYLFNFYYSKNNFHKNSLVLSFIESDQKSADIIITNDFEGQDSKRATVDKSGDKIFINFNSSIVYQAANSKGSCYLLNNAIYYIGYGLGFVSNKKNTVSNPRFLLNDFSSIHKVTRLKSYQLEKFDHLLSYTDLIEEINCIYGFNNHQQIIYGCTDPNATNYVKNALRQSFDCEYETPENINPLGKRLASRNINTPSFFNITDDVTNFVSVTSDGINYIDNWEDSQTIVNYSNIVSSVVISNIQSINNGGLSFPRFVLQIDNTGFVYAHDRFGNRLSNNAAYLSSPGDYNSFDARTLNPLVMHAGSDNKAGNYSTIINTGSRGLRVLAFSDREENYYPNGEIVADCGIETQTDSGGGEQDVKVGNQRVFADSYGLFVFSNTLNYTEESNFQAKSISAANVTDYMASAFGESVSSSVVTDASFSKTSAENIKSVGYTFSALREFDYIDGVDTEFVVQGYNKGATLSVVMFSKDLQHYFVFPAPIGIISAFLSNETDSEISTTIHYPAPYYLNTTTGEKTFRVHYEGGQQVSGLLNGMQSNKIIVRSFSHALLGFNNLQSFLTKKYSENKQAFTDDSDDDQDYIGVLESVPSIMSLKPYDIIDLNVHSATHNNAAQSDLQENCQNTFLSYYVLGVKHGFLLLSYAPNIAQFLPEENGGLASFVPGGKWQHSEINDRNLEVNPVQDSGGFTPVSMEFSLHNNYLYAVMKNPDTLELYLCRYSLHSNATNGLALSMNSLMIPNPFSGDVEKVIRTKDNSILFIAGSEYLKIAESDFDYMGVAQFANPTINSFNTGLSILPVSDSNNINLAEHALGGQDSVFNSYSVDSLESFNINPQGFPSSLYLYGGALNLNSSSLISTSTTPTNLAEPIHGNGLFKDRLAANKFFGTSSARAFAFLPHRAVLEDLNGEVVASAYVHNLATESQFNSLFGTLDSYINANNNAIVLSDKNGNTLVGNIDGLVGSSPVPYAFVQCHSCTNPLNSYAFISYTGNAHIVYTILDFTDANSPQVYSTADAVGQIPGDYSQGILAQSNTRGDKAQYLSGFSIINLDVTTSWILTTYSKFNEDSVYLRAWKFTSSGLESPVDTLIYTTDSAGVATTYYSYSVLTFRGGPHSRLAIAAHANYVNNIGENTALVEGTFNINTGEYIFQTLHSNFATNRSNVVSRGRTVSSELDTIQDLLYSKNANVLYAIYGKYNKNGITPYNGAENTDTNKNRIYIYNIGSSSVRTPSRTELSSNLPGIPIALIPLGYNTDSFNVALGFTHQNNLNLSTPNTENFKIVTISNSDIFASANIDKDTSTFHTVFVVNATRNEDEVFDIIGTGGVKNPVSGNPDGSGTGVVGVEIEEDEDEDVFGCMIPGSANFCATCTTPFEWYILGPDGQQFSANPTIMLGYFDSPDYEVLMLHNHNGDCITWSCDSVGMAYQDEACGFCWETEQEAEQASGQGVDACTFCTDENADNYAWDEYLLCTNEQWFPLNVQQSDLVNQGTGGSVSLSSAVDGSYATLCLESIAFYEASSSWQLENPNDPNLPYTTETLSHCQYTIGCMDAGACNYNPNATIPADDVPWWHQFFEGDSVTDTGDCTYPVPACNCDGSFDVNTSGAIGSTQIDEGGVNMSGSTYCDCANGSPVATPPWFGTNGNFGQLRNTLIYPGASTSIFTNYYGSSYASANEEQEAQLLELCGCGGSVPHTSVGGKPLSDFTDNSLAGPDGVFITNSRRACRCDGTIAQDLFIVNQVELLKGIHGHLATAAVNTKEGRYCDCDGNTTAAGSDNNGCPNNCLYSINASVCGCPYDVPQTQPDGTSQVYYRLPDNYNTTDPTQPMYCNCENGSPTLANIAYDDSDGDLLGNPNMPIYYCGDTPPTGYVTNNGDENPATACDAQEAETYPGGFDADANLENSSFVLPQVGFPVATMPDQLEVIGDIHNGERVFRTWWTTHAAPVGLGTDGVSYQDYFGICAGGVMRGVCGGVLNFINQPTYQDNSGNWRWETRGDYRNDWWLKDSKMQTQGEHQGCCEDTFKGGDGLCYSSQEELPVQACDGSWVPPQFEEASQATACGHCTMVKSSYGSGYGGYNQWGGASNITDAYNSANDEEMYGDCRHNCATLEEMQVNNPSICRCDILTPRPGFPESTTLRYLDECDVCNGTNLCTREGCTEVGAVNLHICFDPVAQLPWELSPNPTPPEALVGSMNCEGVTIINNYGCVFPGEINMEQISSEQIEKTLSNVLFIDPTSESFFNLPVIWNNPTFENSYFGEFGEITITTDNPYYTTKCQVIHRGDPQLILSSPATLAENLYTHENNVVDNSGNEYEGENLVGFDNEIYLESQGFSGDFGVTRWYYFRVKGYLEDTENGVRFATADNLLFNGDGSSINFDEVVARTGFNTQNNITALNLQIVDPLGNKVLPYTYDNVNVPSHSTSYSSINQIGDLKTGVANLALEDFENSTYAKPLYYVYAVRSNNDDSHIIDFSSLFYTEYYGCTDPNACNYDDSANTDDGSCFYEGATDTYGNFIDCAGQQVGCTDPNAKNYNANATIDSGHCVYYQQETYQVCLNPQATEYTYWCTNPDNPNYPNGCDDQGTPFPYIDDTLNVWTTYVEGDSCTLCELPECLDCVTEQYNENIPKCCDPTALNYFGGNLTSCDYCVESSLANPRFPCEYGSVLFENQFLNQECTNCIIYEIQTSSPNFTFTQEILNDFRYIIYDSAGRVVYSSEDSVTHLLEQASPNPFGIASASTNQELITYAAGGTLSESIRRMIDISSLPMGCYTFLPLGFTKNEVWKHTKLTIKLNGQIKHSLISGGSSSSNALGVMGLNIGYGDCVPGCGNSPLEFNPPTCENIAIIDEDGIIEMKLAVQLAQVEQDDAYNRVIVQVINVQTGKVLAQVGGLNSDGVTYQSLIPGATYAESFILTEPETIGVKVVNNSNIMYPIDYSIVANNNKTIISKRSI